jgi:hypothetical protein
MPKAGFDPEGVLTDGLTDEELTTLALAADPDAPLPEGAVPIGIQLIDLMGLCNTYGILGFA